MLKGSALAIGYVEPVVQDISFEIGPGELLLLLGPNGCGKTTLIRSILGAIPLLAGRVEVNGQDVTALSAIQVARAMALVPQDESAPFNFTAREMVAMGRISLSGLWSESYEDRQMVEAAMAAQNCLEVADRPIASLSGGEAQRVRLARAMAQESSIWLLDEPNAHLDIRYQLELESTIRAVVASGKSVLASVHDLAMAQRLAAPVLLLNEGRSIGPMPLSELAKQGTLEAAYGVPFRVNPEGVVEVASS